MSLHSSATLSLSDFEQLTSLSRCRANPPTSPQPHPLPLSKVSRHIMLPLDYEPPYRTDRSDSLVSSVASDDDGEEEDGIIWFGRRDGVDALRAERFWRWVGDREEDGAELDLRTAACKQRSGKEPLVVKLVGMWKRRRSLK